MEGSMTHGWDDFDGCRILVAGAGGQVGVPVVAELAKNNEVFALARFNKPEDEAAMRALGAIPIKVDLGSGALPSLPDGLDYAVNYAVVKSGDFSYDLSANAEGVGRLMMACRGVKAFVHFSSAAVYAYAGHTPRAETDALGDNHRAMFPTYSISKIAAESVVRFVARQFEVPATIARLSVPYGNNGGWPYYHLLMMQAGVPIDLHPEHPNQYNLLHEIDHYAKLPALCSIASTTATTLNFGGSQATSIEQWCDWLSELTGLEAHFKETPEAFGSLAIDTTRMHQLIGPTAVDWRSGVHDMLRVLAPDCLQSAYR
jgi:UDP-glucuronate 4-epimerase